MNSISDWLSRGTLLATVLLFSAAGAAAQVSFDPPRSVAAGRFPIAAASADFDENGIADVACATYEGSEVTIVLSEGGGAFRTATLPTGRNPWDIVAADIDADGDADLVTADYNGMCVTLLRGDGHGGFESWGGLPVGLNPYVVRVADLDFDGGADIVVAGSVDVAVVASDGTDGYRPAVRLGIPSAGSVVSADLADFDGDGFPDLVVLARAAFMPLPQPDEIFVLRGDGAGGFVPSGRFAADPGLTFGLDVHARDVSGDGHADVVIAGFAHGAFALFGDGTGAFLLPALSVPIGGAVERVAIGDFDEDGRLDFAGSNTNPDRSLGIATRTPDGGFAAPLVFPAGSFPRRLAVGDFDGDRHLDVALPIAGSGADGPGVLDFYFNRTTSLCRAGTVNAGAGTITDVLFVNDSAGRPERQVVLATHEPLVVFLAAPPAASGPVPFALYAWAGEARPGDERRLPFGIGTLCRPGPPHGGSPDLRAVWNNTGRGALGAPDRVAPFAPAVVVTRPDGLGRHAKVFLQGIVADPASAAERPASVTNGVQVEIR